MSHLDLSKFNPRKAAEAGISVTLRSPASNRVILDSKEKPLVIVILGRDSKRWRDLARDIKRRNAELPVGTPRTEDDVDAELLEILSNCTVSVSSNIRLKDGAELKTVADYLRLYTEESWIAEQVLNSGTDRSRLDLGKS